MRFITNSLVKSVLHKKQGFFVECGAADGEFLSNTLYMERYMKWKGLLIEPEPMSYAELLSRKRKAWTASVCLSLNKYPTAVRSIFMAIYCTLLKYHKCLMLSR